MDTTQPETTSKDSIIEKTYGDKTYILVGTAHVSQESVADVQRNIVEHAPQRVCIELDLPRYTSLTQAESWRNIDIFKIIKDGKGPLLLSNLLLSSYQKRLGLDAGIKPGEEMKAAVAKSEELGIPFSLIDRDIQITLRRAWGTSSFFGKMKLIATLIESVFSREKIDASQIEELKKTSALHGMLDELASYLPKVKEVLIDERDQFMAAKLFETTENRVLAVVGAGHVPGMIQWLDALHAGTKYIDSSAISVVPKPSIVPKIISWIFPVAIVGLIVLGFVNGGSKGLNSLITWLLWHGGLAALGSLIALANPLAILAAFVCAPIGTMIHVGPGFFAALTEAFLRRPRVHDLENLQDDITTLRGFFRNRVTRILLIFVLTNIGGMIGNIIALPAMIRVNVG